MKKTFITLSILSLFSFSVVSCVSAPNSTSVLRFLNYDGNVLKSYLVPTGTTFKIVDSVIQPNDAQYTYSFDGWNGSVGGTNYLLNDTIVVKKSENFIPVIEKTLNYYNVTFLAEDRKTILYSDNVAYGTAAKFVGDTPSKVSTKEYYYTFSNWLRSTGPSDSNINFITGDTYFYPSFTENRQVYKVVYKNYNEVKLDDKNFYYGEDASKEIATPKKVSPFHTYTFKEWSPKVSKIEENTTTKALFNQEKTLLKNINNVYANDKFSLVSTNNTSNNDEYYFYQSGEGNNPFSNEKLDQNEFKTLNNEKLNNNFSFALGNSSNLALRSDGNVYSFGSSEYVDEKIQIIPIIADGISIGASDNQLIVATSSGKVFTWGLNKYGANGNKNNTASRVPSEHIIKTVKTNTDGAQTTTVETTHKIDYVTCSNNTSFALDENGKLFASGRNNLGQFGNASTIDTKEFVLIENAPVSFKKVEAHDNYTVALGIDNNLYYTGTYANKNVTSFTKFSDAPSIISDFSSSDGHILIINDGNLYTMGKNDKLQLGRIEDDAFTCEKILTDYKFKDVAAGNGYSLAVSNDTSRTLFVFGDNSHKQLGVGTDLIQKGIVDL